MRDYAQVRDFFGGCDVKSESNLDQKVVKGFGQEWSKYDQSALEHEELEILFHSYFSLFPFDEIGADATGFDMGCGSGRWASLVAPRVGKLLCVDPSPVALSRAKERLENFNNVEFECAGVSESKITANSQDFGYSLGVLHHIPDTLAGVKACSAMLKPGAPFLIYLYYSLENRPWWFRLIWRSSDGVRFFLSRLPFSLKLLVSQVIAILVYWPLARLAKLVERRGIAVNNLPLSYYREKSLYTMKTDALDRFGTSLEKRFSRAEIAEMLEACGFEGVTFSEREPYWVALARRA